VLLPLGILSVPPCVVMLLLPCLLFCVFLHLFLGYHTVFVVHRYRLICCRCRYQSCERVVRLFWVFYVPLPLPLLRYRLLPLFRFVCRCRCSGCRSFVLPLPSVVVLSFLVPLWVLRCVTATYLPLSWALPVCVVRCCRWCYRCLLLHCDLSLRWLPAIVTCSLLIVYRYVVCRLLHLIVTVVALPLPLRCRVRYRLLRCCRCCVYYLRCCCRVGLFALPAFVVYRCLPLLFGYHVANCSSDRCTFVCSVDGTVARCSLLLLCRCSAVVPLRYVVLPIRCCSVTVVLFYPFLGALRSLPRWACFGRLGRYVCGVTTALYRVDRCVHTGRRGFGAVLPRLELRFAALPIVRLPRLRDCAIYHVLRHRCVPTVTRRLRCFYTERVCVPLPCGRRYHATLMPLRRWRLRSLYRSCLTAAALLYRNGAVAVPFGLPFCRCSVRLR